MDDLVQFLRARLDDDEQVARAAHAPNWSTDGRTGLHYGVEDGWMTDALTTADADHIARHDPARVLADVEAKREVIAKYTKAVEQMAELASLCERLKADGKDTFMPEMNRATAIHRRDVLYEVLRLLAPPYADHADYRDDWRP